MAMKLQNAGADPAPDMNTTPLIDVMLVLLTILIITLPMRTHAVKLDLGAPVGPPPPVVVDLAVEFDGTVLWNGHAVDRKTLDAYLADAARLNPQPEIHIEADKLARYAAVAKIMADAQRLGVAKIGIVGTDRYLQ